MTFSIEETGMLMFLDKFTDRVLAKNVLELNSFLTRECQHFNEM